MVVYPFLFSLFAILSVVASNLGVINLSQVFRPLVIALVITFLLLLLIQAIIRDWRMAGFICLLVLLFIFSYGHIHAIFLVLSYSLMDRIFEFISGNRLAVWIHPFLIAFWAWLVFWVLRRFRGAQDKLVPITQGLNIAFLVLVLISMFRIVSSLREMSGSPQTDVSGLSSQEKASSTTDGFPDIYYFVLDGYAGEGVLKEIYDLDNSAFLSFLESTGFYVAHESRSNYSQTALSLASSLNMTYLEELRDDIDPNSKDVNWLIPWIRNNELRNVLEDHGYTTIAFETGYSRTEIEDADIYLEMPKRSTGTLESLLIRSSALLILEDLSSELGWPFPYSGYASHRDRILYTISMLSSVSDMPSPKFVFVHLLVPHPPFVFDQDGEQVRQIYKYGLRDASDFQGSSQEYIQGYRDQLLWVNRQMEQTLPEIISNSKTPPIILLQADHGPGASLQWEDPEESNIVERMSILNAYRLPGASDDLFPDTISPVNSFRVVLNYVFDAGYPLVIDQSYFSSTRQPFDFAELPY